MSRTPPLEPARRWLATTERRAIDQALEELRFNKSNAARRLGLTRSQLYVRLRRYGLN